MATATGVLSQSGWQIVLAGFGRVLREPLGLLGFVLVTIMVAGALFADLIVPYDPIAIAPRDRLLPPSLDHLLGTDQLGRDLFSRVVVGGRVALEVALVCISLAMAVGLALGMLAGFGPRWLDNALILLFDTVRSFPTVMFALAIVTLVGPSLETVILVGLGGLLSGAVFAEIVFARPGIGKLIYDAVITRNYPVVMGAVLVTTTLLVLSTLIADLVAAKLDPRIRETL